MQDLKKRRLQLAGKLAILLLASLSALALMFASKPGARTSAENELLFSNPYLFRAISNISHTLLADRLWLMSADIGEIVKKDSYTIDAGEFFAASKTITVMDPYFFPAVNYAATYLSSIHKDINGSIALYETARLYDKNNFLLYFNEMLLRATYQNPVDDDAMVRLAKEASLMPENRKFFKKENVGNMVEDFIVFARNKRGRDAQARKDLQWLLKNSTSEQRKKEIVRRLSAMAQDR